MKKRFMRMLAAVCVLGLCACGGSADQAQIQALRPEQGAMEEVSRGNAGAGDSEAGQPPLTYEASDVAAAVRCSDRVFMKNIFAAGAKHVYICGNRENGDGVIGVMRAPDSAEEASGEAGEMQALDIEQPEGMRAFRMAVDRRGNCHILWRSTEKKIVDGREFDAFNYDRAQIMKINSEGAVEKNIDVSEPVAAEQSIFHCFEVDDAGNYYYEKGTDILKLSPEGELLSRVSCERAVESIGIGRSGTLYCVQHKEDRLDYVYRVEEDTVTELAALPEAVALYPCMGAGTDTELILLRKDGGIYAVDFGEKTGESAGVDEIMSRDGVSVELRVPEADMPVSGQDISGFDILGDGRVCLYGYENGESMVYYVPVGR